MKKNKTIAVSLKTERRMVFNIMLLSLFSGATEEVAKVRRSILAKSKQAVEAF